MIDSFTFPDLRKQARIAVFGGRKASETILKSAYDFGTLAAKEGWIILNGGKNGVMEAVSKGVFDAKGLSIGILPGADLKQANDYLQIALPTDIGIARNEILARSAHICIAIGGSYGTLSEIAYALSMEKPVLSLSSWNIDGVLKVANSIEAVEKIRSLLK